MKHLTLSVQPRTVLGKQVKHLRADGMVPGVVYGGALDEPKSLQMNLRELDRVLVQAGTSTVIDLQIEGSRSLPVLARVVQRHPLRHTVTHVDFLAVRMDRPITVAVPVQLVGESEAVEAKTALLMTLLDTVEVEALPDNLPSHLELDISVLTEAGQNLTAGDIALPANVTLVSDPEAQVVSLAAPSLTLEEEDAIAAEEEGVEEGAEEGAEDAEAEASAEGDDAGDEG